MHPSSRAVNSARKLGPWTHHHHHLIRVVETDLKTVFFRGALLCCPDLAGEFTSRIGVQGRRTFCPPEFVPPFFREKFALGCLIYMKMIHSVLCVMNCRLPERCSAGILRERNNLLLLRIYCNLRDTRSLSSLSFTCLSDMQCSHIIHNISVI